MLFNTIQFFVFFTILTTIYFLIPHAFRWGLLLLASYYFYMCWNPVYIFLIVISTLIDYFAAIMMGRESSKIKKKKFLYLSLLSNLGLLFAFKYFNFFNSSLQILIENFSFAYKIPNLNVLLPVGISFYTFQTLSYSIDVYNGKRKPEKHLGIFALYVSFFPQLVAGPIERSERLMPQFYKKINFDYERITDGLKLVLWGLFKKVVIADRVSYIVNYIYGDVHSFTGLPLIIGTILFAFQIYCDFSGYSDMAIGLAQVLGFNLMDNFKRPYFSKSIAEFWRRWHISLSSWFKDYVYIPMGGNKTVKWRWYYNLFVVFLISGLWHGANWTFVIWGALHGFYLLFSIISTSHRDNLSKLLKLNKTPVLHNYLKILITFSLVCFSWIFFRANNVSDAFYVVTHLFANIFDSSMLQIVFSGFNVGATSFLITLTAIGFMEFVHSIQRHGSIRHMLKQKPALLRAGVYSFMVLLIVFFGEFSAQQFIYFQF